ncbi:MAG: phosphate ABC transporter permease PstA [Actinomycetota bacterium]|nr:phosphate ABC transporter permease PstA [Actinomycetota bacterium]
METMTTRSLVATDAVRRALRGRPLDLRGRLFEAALLGALLVSLALLVTLLMDIGLGGWEVLARRGWGFVTSPISLDPIRAGVGQAIVGSVLLMAFVALIAFPLGIGAAVYLEEYALDNAFTRLVDTNIRNLAGVPSIVYGLLGLSLFVSFAGRSVIAGGLTLAVLVLPITIITAAEALRAVPAGIREAAFGVGATQWQAVRHHILPVAAPGILTGTILSLARAFGEAAPLLVVGAVTGFFTTGDQGLLEQLGGRYTALPMAVFNWARQPGEGFRALTSAAIIVLLAVLLTVNAAAILLRNRYEREVR